MFTFGGRKTATKRPKNGSSDRKTEEYHGGTSSSSSSLLASAFQNLVLSDGEYAQHQTSNLPPGITPETANEMLAKTMNSLSVQERNKTFEAIHGCKNSPFASVPKPKSDSMATSSNGDKEPGRQDGDVEEDYVIDDDPEHDLGSYGNGANARMKTPLVNQRLQQMKNELLERCNKVLQTYPARYAENQREEKKEPKHTDIDNGNNLPAYVIAMQRNADYVMSLRLMFLRCEDYNVKDAIARLIAFLDYKLELFPISKLTKDITLQDLEEMDPNDMKYLNAGYHQILPGTDNCGRTIIFFHRGNTQQELELFDSIPVNSILRVVLYMVMTHIQVPDYQHSIQKSGYVVVGYDFSNVFKSTTFNYESQLYAWKVCKLINVLPYQLNCIHYCYNDKAIDLLVAIARTALGGRSRTRFRPHTGKSYVEIMYELMTYGITQDQLPIITNNDRCRAGSSITTYSGHQEEGLVALDKHNLFLQRIQSLEKQQQLQLDPKVQSPISGSTISSPILQSTASNSGGIAPSTTTRQQLASSKSVEDGGECMLRSVL